MWKQLNKKIWFDSQKRSFFENTPVLLLLSYAAWRAKNFMMSD